MHEPVQMMCIFGCRGYRDEIRHYVQCAPLWLIVAEVMSQQSPFDLAERICMKDPSPETVVRLAVCFQSYHYAKSLCGSNVAEDGSVRNPQVLQRAALESAKTFLSHVK